MPSRRSSNPINTESTLVEDIAELVRRYLTRPNRTQRYNGTIDGTINNFFKIGWNKYMLVLDNGVNVIKLK